MKVFKFNLQRFTVFSNNDDNKVVTGGDYSGDTILNYGKNVTVQALGGNDTVYNYTNADYAYIDLSAGDDVFYGSPEGNNGANQVTIIGGDGNDKIGVDTMQNVVIDSGDGNDTISGGAYSSTITAGKGEDYIDIGDSRDVQINYFYGDGNDTIYSQYKNNYILNITTPSAFSTVAADNGTGNKRNIVLQFDNGESITFINGVDQSFSMSNIHTVQGGVANPIATTPATSSTDTTPAASSTDTTPATSSTNTTPAASSTNTTSATSKNISFSGGTSKTVQRFVTGTGSNANVLVFQTSLSSLSRTNGVMYFYATDGTKLQVNNSSSVDQIIQYSTDGKNISYAKVGNTRDSNSFTYVNSVNYYAGGNYTDVLKVADSTGRNIWLNGQYGTAQFDNVENIDASTSTGNNTLAGDSNSNQITAGKGNDSLWGGSGKSSLWNTSGNDTLIGGDGQNMFWYGKNDGNDVINKAASNDSVNLYDVRLSDITSVSYGTNSISVNLNSGGSLQINGTSSLSSKFMLADGTRWQYNHSSQTWKNA